MTTTLRETGVCGRAASAGTDPGPTVRLMSCDRTAGHDGPHAFLATGETLAGDPRLTISDETVAARRAWLDASRALGAHIDDCLCCLVDWTPDCPEVETFRRAADDAWAVYEAARS